MLDYATQIFTALFPVAGIGIGIALAFHIIGSLNRAISGAVIDREPPAKRATYIPPMREPQPKLASETFNSLMKLLDWIAEQRRPANCPQCGGPASRKSDQCQYCGSKL